MGRTKKTGGSMECKNRNLSKQGIIDTVLLCLLCMLVSISVHAEDINIEQFKSLFPEPPIGWASDTLQVKEITADKLDLEVMVDALFGEKKTHYQGTRTYIQKGNRGHLTVEISTSECTKASLIPRENELKDPAVLKQYKESNVHPFNHLSCSGVMIYDDQKRIELIGLDIGLCRIVEIAVDTFGDKDAAITFFKQLNFDKLKAFMKHY